VGKTKEKWGLDGKEGRGKMADTGFSPYVFFYGIQHNYNELSSNRKR